MSRRPVVCLLTGTLNALAGAERVCAAIANGLARRGYRVHILSLWDHASCFALEDSVRHDAIFAARPSFKRKYVATVGAIRRYLRQHEVEVLIEVDTMLTLFTVPACLGLPVRRFAWEHCHFDQDLGRRARRAARLLAARTAAGIVVLTQRDRQRWLEAVQPRCPVTLIPNALPFPYPEHAAAGRSKRVLAVGRLTAAKGFDILLRAWPTVVAAYPDWELQIIGEGEDRPALAALRDTLGIAASVSMPGATQEVTAAYGQAAIFCLSSHYEGFGLVLVEAMSYGLPVISTDCETGPRELLSDGANALLVPPGDPAALAQALMRAIASPALRTELGHAGREFAQRFAEPQVLDRWEALLQAAAVAPRA